MEEYISREAAINAVYNGFLKDDPFLFPDQVRETNVYKKMCEVPAADVRPVVHGEWTLNRDGSGKCNECGMTQKNVWDDDTCQRYCCCCGAVMDGGSNG